MNPLSVSIPRSRQIAAWVYWLVQNLLLSPLLGTLSAMFADRISPSVFQFIYYALNFTALTAILGRFLVDSGKAAFTELRLVLRSAFLGYWGYWIATLILGQLSFRLLPDFENLNDSAIMTMAANARVLTHISTVLLAPVAEELVFRGLVFGPLYEKKPWIGYTVSTVIFSALHILGYLGRYSPLALLVAFLQYLPAGLCLGWAYARSKNIWAPILMHIAINQIAMMSLR